MSISSNVGTAFLLASLSLYSMACNNGSRTGSDFFVSNNWTSQNASTGKNSSSYTTISHAISNRILTQYWVKMYSIGDSSIVDTTYYAEVRKIDGSHLKLTARSPNGADVTQVIAAINDSILVLCPILGNHYAVYRISPR